MDVRRKTMKIHPKCKLYIKYYNDYSFSETSVRDTTRNDAILVWYPENILNSTHVCNLRDCNIHDCDGYKEYLKHLLERL